MNLAQKRLRAVIWCAVSTKKQAEDDKMSLAAQEADGRALAEKEGWDIVAVLIVPGHSRRDIDYHVIAQKAATAKKDKTMAFIELERMWTASAFDILIVRDGQRFARSQAAHAYIIENVIIGAKARIFSFQDGWIDKTNLRFMVAFGGFRAAGEVDTLVKLQIAGKNANASRGVPVNARPVWSHRVIRNVKTGKVEKQVPDESKRQIIEDAARLLIEGVGWQSIETELYRRFGHTKDGRPFFVDFFYALFHNPLFWGNNARHYRNPKSPNGQKSGLWVFDLDLTPPEGVTLNANTHEPALTGELAEKLKAEMRRRTSTIRGKTLPHRTKMFTGLLICDYCGFILTYNEAKGHNAYACKSKYYATRRDRCDRYRPISQRYIKTWFDSALRQMLERNDPDMLLRRDGQSDALLRVNRLQEQVVDTEAQSRRLIAKQRTADDIFSSMYEEELANLAQQLKKLRGELKDAERIVSNAESEDAKLTFDELRALGLEAFWQQPETQINQMLHRLMGRRRITVRDKEILGVEQV